jgi:hypothetical protein
MNNSNLKARIRVLKIKFNCLKYKILVPCKNFKSFKINMIIQVKKIDLKLFIKKMNMEHRNKKSCIQVKIKKKT